jgi:chaperonin cofactor prefoldin
VQVERLSIYNADVLASNPLSGVRLTNSTENHLLAGPLSIYDGGGYAGDASIEDLPPGQERLLSYAIDLEVGMRVEPKVTDGVLVSGKIVRGVLHTQHRFRNSRAYHADNRGPRDKRLIIEHPRRSQWTLADTPKPIEETDALYRFELAVPAGKGGDLEVNEEFVSSEALVLLDGDAEQLAAIVQSRGMPAPVRDALQQVLERRRALATTQQDIARRRDEIQSIRREQQDIRANLGSVKSDAEYHNRLLKKLDDQETRIEKLQAEIRDLETRQAQQRAELEKMLEDLTLG